MKPGLIDAVAIALAVEEAQQKGHTLHPVTRVDQLIGGDEYRLRAKAALAAAMADRGPDKIDFVWTEVGENNDEPKFRLELNDGDYIADVFNSYEDGLWVMILNRSGHRRIESEAAAKAKAEELILTDIKKRLVAARLTLELYAA